MADKSLLSWPFITDRHRALAEAIEAWIAANLPTRHDDIDVACRERVARLGHMAEKLCREIRALRIYEGVPEVEKAVIERQMLAGA